MPRYYDIDTILAEDEILTVKPKFSFAHLSHLDPDYSSRKRPRGNDDGLPSKPPSSNHHHHHHLPEGTKIRMPLWVVDRWAHLNFVRIPVLPKHYRQRTKERLEADAIQMNLSSSTDHYYLSGMLLVNLLLRTVHVYKANNPPSSTVRRGGVNNNDTIEQQSMNRLAYDARSLQSSLLSSMMGPRLCRNFDWTLSALDAMEDDVSGWVRRLSYLERRMFHAGLRASGAVKSWREYGCGRLGVSLAVTKGRSQQTMTSSSGGEGMSSSSEGGKRRRVVSPTSNL
jgi:hypothetical protein